VVEIASDQSQLAQRVQTDGSRFGGDNDEDNGNDDRDRDASECQPRSESIPDKILGRIFDRRCWDWLSSNLDSLVARDSGDSDDDDDDVGQVDNTRARGPHFHVQLTTIPPRARDDKLSANLDRYFGYLSIGCCKNDPGTRDQKRTPYLRPSTPTPGGSVSDLRTGFPCASNRKDRDN